MEDITKARRPISAVTRRVLDDLQRLNARLPAEQAVPIPRQSTLARAISRRIDELEERIVELRKQEELDALRPPIDGNDVMDHLGLDPGPEVGEAMRMLLDHRIERGPYEPEEAYRLLDEWWAARS